MTPSLRLRTTTVCSVHKLAIPVPGAAAITVRPNPATGQSQALVVSHLGICPLRLNDFDDGVRLDPPLSLRNHCASKLNYRTIYDATYDPHSGLVLLAHGTGVYGMDATNRVAQLAGDYEGGLIYDGAAADARFVGAQRLATDERGVTYIRDRDASSLNGFCLRALFEATSPCGSGGSGDRAVVTVHLAGSTGPHCMTWCTRRRSLLFARRGRALHQLLPYGMTQELLGTDEPPMVAHASAAAAAASASSSASEQSEDDDGDDDALYNSDSSGARAVRQRFAAVAVPRPPFTNIQALAADAVSGDVYILDGTTGSRTQLRVLRPNGCLDTLDEQLHIGPPGSSRCPRLAVLPCGHLAVYATSAHEIMVIRL